MTPKFPVVHLGSTSGNFLGFVKKWITRPIKRRLAKYYLLLLQNFTEITVIGITGSAGKTTTKDMIAAILKSSAKTVSSKANIDPIYNIPNTVLRTGWGTKFLVLEMGVEYPTEMDFYLWLANPDVAVITNIFPTHTEYFGGIEGVLKEKSKLALTRTKDNICILNSDDKNLHKIAKKIKANIFWFKGELDPIMSNRNAAAEVGTRLGIKKTLIDKALKSFKNPPHRLHSLTHKSGAQILDDTYNSNPKAAIATLDYFNGRVPKGLKIAVLGDMLELGSYEKAAHRLVGKEVAKSGFEAVIGVGKSAKYIIKEVEKTSPDTKTFLVEKADQVLPHLKQYLKKGSFILLKGSRSIGLDSVVNNLTGERQ